MTNWSNANYYHTCFTLHNQLCLLNEYLHWGWKKLSSEYIYIGPFIFKQNLRFFVCTQFVFLRDRDKSHELIAHGQINGLILSQFKFYKKECIPSQIETNRFFDNNMYNNNQKKKELDCIIVIHPFNRGTTKTMYI